MLIGSYQHTVDAKGRVFIPAKYRNDLGAHFYIYKSIDGCIRAYSEDDFNAFIEKLKQTTIKDIDARRIVLSMTTDVDMDTQGRILLPDEMRTETMITDKVRIVGMAQWVEFWSPERYAERNSKVDNERVIEILSELGIS